MVSQAIQLYDVRVSINFLYSLVTFISGNLAAPHPSHLDSTQLIGTRPRKRFDIKFHGLLSRISHSTEISSKGVLFHGKFLILRSPFHLMTDKFYMYVYIVRIVC